MAQLTRRLHPGGNTQTTDTIAAGRLIHRRSTRRRAILPSAAACVTRESSGRYYLGGIDFRVRQDWLQPTTRAEVLQYTAESVVNMANESHADLIALATHGRGGPARRVFDTATERWCAALRVRRSSTAHRCERCWSRPRAVC
jgi:hypothetical protein